MIPDKTGDRNQDATIDRKKKDNVLIKLLAISYISKCGE